MFFGNFFSLHGPKLCANDLKFSLSLEIKMRELKKTGLGQLTGREKKYFGNSKGVV